MSNTKREHSAKVNFGMMDIEMIVSAATAAEKSSFLSGKGLWRTAPIDRLGVPSILMTDGTHGVRYSEAQIDHGQSWGRRDASGRAVPPSGQTDEHRPGELNSAPEWLAFGQSRPATCFPTGSSL
jgi:beta-glucosidase